jgi:hypothetical protein
MEEGRKEKIKRAGNEKKKGSCNTNIAVDQ